jgi:hypothetical protein
VTHYRVPATTSSSFHVRASTIGAAAGAFSIFDEDRQRMMPIAWREKYSMLVSPAFTGVLL